MNVAHVLHSYEELMLSEHERLTTMLKKTARVEHILLHEIAALVELSSSLCHHPENDDTDEDTRDVNLSSDQDFMLAEGDEQDEAYLNKVLYDSQNMDTMSLGTAKYGKPLPVDMHGHLIMPIILGKPSWRVSIFCMGMIPSSYPLDNYHTCEFIYPIGFSSRRKYIHPKDKSKKCPYTFMILDGGYEGPIVSHVTSYDDEHHVFSILTSQYYVA